VFDVARYLTELSVCVSTFTFYARNSVIAYACILCAIDALEDTIPLHRDIRDEFLCNVAIATGLLPDLKEVLEVQSLLMEICPSLREHDVSDIIADLDDGKASPVCISEDLVCNDGDFVPSTPERSFMDEDHSSSGPV